MTEVTVKVDALKGRFTIRADETKQNVFSAFGTKYVPFQIEAESLGQAVDAFMQNTHRLKRNTDRKIADAVKGSKINATREANILAKYGININDVKEKTKPTVLKDKKAG